jgi:hypothetical protein
MKGIVLEDLENDKTLQHKCTMKSANAMGQVPQYITTTQKCRQMFSYFRGRLS